MGLVANIKQRARKWLGVDALGTWFGGFFWEPGSVSSSGVVVTPDVALQTSAVFRCVNILANAVASMPLKVYERTGDGKQPATNYYLYKVLHSTPNRWQTSVEWRAMMEAHRCLRGNAYSLIVGGRNGFASELIPLHPDRMRIEPLENGKLRYIYRNDKGLDKPYAQEEIFHLRGLSTDGVYGLSVLSAARDAIGLSRSMEDYGGKLFKNGAKPSLVFSSDQPIQEKAMARILEDWHKANSGENSGKTAFMPFGLKPVQMGLSNDDAQFLETRKFQLSDIARFFGVPPHKIYDLERATFSNIEHQGLEFVQDTLLPIARIWEAAISRDLIADDDRYFAEFNFDFYLRGDTAARAAFYKEMFYMGMSPNEIRALENMNNIGDDGDKRFVPVNMTTLEKAGEEPPPGADPNGPEPEPEKPKSKLSVDADEVARGLIDDDLLKLRRWETDAVNRAATNPREFSLTVDAFYKKHHERLGERLTRWASLYEGGIEIAGFILEQKARQQSVIEAAGTCTADKLKETIHALTATWLPKEEEHAAA